MSGNEDCFEKIIWFCSGTAQSHRHAPRGRHFIIGGCGSCGRLRPPDERLATTERPGGVGGPANRRWVKRHEMLLGQTVFRSLPTL